MPKDKKEMLKELLFSLILTIILMIFPVLSGAIVTINKIEAPKTYWVQGIFMLISILVPLCIIFKNRMRLKDIGFLKPDKKGIKAVLYFIPIILAKTGYLFFELNHETAILISLLFFSITVALSEEIYFRGIIIVRLLKHFSIKQTVLISSLLFALAHASLAFSGEKLLYVILTIINAFIFGIVASLIRIFTKSIIPTIVWHALYNFINWITLVQNPQKTILIILELIIMIFSGIYFWLKLPKKQT